MNSFVSTPYSLESHLGWGGNYVILHHANVFIVEDNIYGIKVVPLTTLTEKLVSGIRNRSYNPSNGCSFYLVFPRFSTFLFIFMNMQMR